MHTKNRWKIRHPNYCIEEIIRFHLSFISMIWFSFNSRPMWPKKSIYISSLIFCSRTKEPCFVCNSSSSISFHSNEGQRGCDREREREAKRNHDTGRYPGVFEKIITKSFFFSFVQFILLLIIDSLRAWKVNGENSGRLWYTFLSLSFI